VIWVYAVAEDADRPLPAPLEGVRAGDLVAVIARDRPPEEPGPEAFWAHERVVEQAMADRAVLPMRFGTTQPDDEALREALLARHDEFRAALARVRGRVELSVRAVADGAPPAAEAATGREWLHARLDASRLADAVHEPLAALAVADRRRPVPGDLLRAAYLVERSEIDRFGAEVERVRREVDGLAVVCTCPWPPYSFVDAPPETAT
jgi:Gas vesicle synthesis protein GvpL/GvpF